MTPQALSDTDRRKLLGVLASLKSDDDDAVAQDAKWFLPLEAHLRALRLETLVVRGGRGAGKSSLFHFLGHLQRQPKLGEHLGVASTVGQITWVEGFSAAASHPSSNVLGAFGKSSNDDDLRAFWFGWLCRRISEESRTPLPAQIALATIEPNDAKRIADVANEQLGPLSSWLDTVERGRSHPIVVTYDGLDRIGTASAVRRAMTSSLLAMWLSLADRYRNIRPKIFVREDLFQASLSAFPDASKLDARSTSIEWRVEDLYRVLIKHMANSSDDLRGWVEGSSRGIPIHEAGGLGWMPPETLPETGRHSQKNFVDHLAGELMGTGTKKGLTYRWIPNRLQDAHARAVPRSILALVRNAAEFALNHDAQASRLRLLHPTELAGALEKTSSRRVKELTEEFPVVRRLDHLRGRTVMLARNDTVKALSKQSPSADEYGDDGEEVLRVLIELGAMSERPDGRIDVPDIYRYGFGIQRKGGVKRPV